MIKRQSIFTCFWRNLPSDRRPNSATLCVFALSAMLGADAAPAAPVILSQPFSAKPGDVISLEGSGFGSAPTVYLQPSRQTTPIALATKAAAGGGVIVEVPKTAAFDLYSVWIVNGGSASASISLNAPYPMHFDNAEVASGAHLRIFGRNLYVNGVAPTVTLIDVQTAAQVSATVTLSTSSAYCLDIVPSSGIIAGHSYQTNVSNGYGSAVSSASIVGHAAGTDYFQIGQPWAYDFQYQNGPGYQPGNWTNQADHHWFNVKTDPSLKLWAKGDGVTNDAAAINAAIVLASANGGIVYFPAGTYNTGTTTISMRSNVVLKGQSAATTKILYGPTYPGGVYFPPGSQMMGLTDLSLQNVDLTSQYVVGLGTGNQRVSKVFLQHLNWDFGSGKGLVMAGDRIAILNSTFIQAINYQGGNAAQQTGGMGPIYIGNKTLGSTTNFQFKSNVVKWATGQNSILDVVNAILENNHFTRSASDKIAAPADPSWGGYATSVPPSFGYMRVMGRPLSLNWGKNVVIQNNVFDTSNGVISYNWNDGEAILNEAGGPSAWQREDVATVSAAASSSLTAVCVGSCAWNVYPNSIAVIISGAGAGQWRHITQASGNTFTLDKSFSVIPAPGDYFAISQPGYENAIIRNNTLSGNPIGISMYKGSFFNVSILANQLTDSGGINLVTSQGVQAPIQRFNTSQNIEIKGNIVKNTKGWYPAYIATFFNIQTRNILLGTSTFGLEIRNNQITAKLGTPVPLAREGFGLYDIYQTLNAGDFYDQGTSWVTGTVYQGNSCANCPINYRLSNTDNDTAIWNAATTNSPGVASTFVSDLPMGHTNFGGAAPHGSVGTVIGND